MSKDEYDAIINKLVNKTIEKHIPDAEKYVSKTILRDVATFITAMTVGSLGIASIPFTILYKKYLDLKSKKSDDEALENKSAFKKYLAGALASWSLLSGIAMYDTMKHRSIKTYNIQTEDVISICVEGYNPTELRFRLLNDGAIPLLHYISKGLGYDYPNECIVESWDGSAGFIFDYAIKDKTENSIDKKTYIRKYATENLKKYIQKKK